MRMHTHVDRNGNISILSFVFARFGFVCILFNNQKIERCAMFMYGLFCFISAHYGHCIIGGMMQAARWNGMWKIMQIIITEGTYVHSCFCFMIRHVRLFIYFPNQHVACCCFCFPGFFSVGSGLNQLQACNRGAIFAWQGV